MTLNPLALRLATAWNSRFTYEWSPITGLFLCAEPDEAFFCPAVFELGSDPVEATGNPSTIVGVLVTVESFEEEHPFISAEVNGFRRRWVSHEWSLAVSVNGLYCSTRVKGMPPCSAPSSIY